jgi:hypothetical protein
MACGLITMIAHINLTSVVPDDEKMMWRRHLWWGGPITAGLYLWRAGEAKSRRSANPKSI